MHEDTLEKKGANQKAHKLLNKSTRWNTKTVSRWTESAAVCFRGYESTEFNT
jgi:hypothetical protein